MDHFTAGFLLIIYMEPNNLPQIATNSEILDETPF
jgi:hypothetical protein